MSMAKKHEALAAAAAATPTNQAPAKSRSWPHSSSTSFYIDGLRHYSLLHMNDWRQMLHTATMWGKRGAGRQHLEPGCDCGCSKPHAQPTCPRVTAQHVRQEHTQSTGHPPMVSALLFTSSWLLPPTKQRMRARDARSVGHRQQGEGGWAAMVADGSCAVKCSGGGAGVAQAACCRPYAVMRQRHPPAIFFSFSCLRCRAIAAFWPLPAGGRGGAGHSK